jgi:hypothetical protein
MSVNAFPVVGNVNRVLITNVESSTIDHATALGLRYTLPVLANPAFLGFLKDSVLNSGLVNNPQYRHGSNSVS